MIFKKDEIVNKYKIIEFKGSGSFGETYRALHLGLNQERALKFCKITSRQKIKDILHEARVQVDLKNNYIVKIYDVDKYIKRDTNERFLYIDMEYINGGTFGSYMQKNFVSIKSAIDIFMNILFALEFIHNKNIIHRDVKPDNILMIDVNTPKLSDFGLSSIIGENWKMEYGYQGHIPPECYTSEVFDKNIDVFASGMTLYRMINNYKNWDEIINRLNDNDIINGNIIKKIGFNQWIPDKVKRIINKATNKDPNRRYKSITEFKNALSKLNIIYDWAPAKNGLGWSGTGTKRTYKIEITHRPRLKKWDVVIKKNNRKFKNLLCNSEQEAFDKMFEFIRGTYNEQ